MDKYFWDKKHSMVHTAHRQLWFLATAHCCPILEWLGSVDGDVVRTVERA